MAVSVSLLAVRVLGYLSSVSVLFAPAITFWRVRRNGTTGGLSSLPYIMALLSAMVWVYYACTMAVIGADILVVNSVGIVLESVYISLYIYYAVGQRQIQTVYRLLFGLGCFVAMVLATFFLSYGVARHAIVNMVCLACNIGVFAMPLTTVVQVLRRGEGVNNIPFGLVCCLTVSGSVWLVYGLLTRNRVVSIANGIGLGLSVVQLIVYAVYRNREA